MDVHEYRKFLSKIFPSKHINNKIKAGDKLKKVIEELDDEAALPNKNSSKNKNNKNSDDDDELCDTDPDEDNGLVRRKAINNKKAKKPKKVEEEEDDEDEPVLKNKNVNIIFTIGGRDETEDEWEDYDSDYDSEDEDDVSEDEDEEVSTDEDDSDDEAEEESEDEVVNKKVKRISAKNNSNQTTSDSPDVSSTPTDTLVQLQKLLESNPNDKSIQKCISVYEEDIKTQQVKLEKKAVKQKDKNLRIFRRVITDKNKTNDFTFYEKLDVEQQKKNQKLVVAIGELAIRHISGKLMERFAWLIKNQAK